MKIFWHPLYEKSASAGAGAGAGAGVGAGAGAGAITKKLRCVQNNFCGADIPSPH